MANDTIRQANPTKLSVTNADAERAVERYRRIRAENTELREEVATLTEDYKTLDAENRALNSALVAQREDLRTIPTDGEEWRENVLYTAGMTVSVKDTKYTALRWNQDKPPDKYPEYWELKPTEEKYPGWSELPEGVPVLEGVRCWQDGVLYVCVSQHIKSNVYKPKGGSSKWEVVSDDVSKRQA